MPWAHPRVCGENGRTHASENRVAGSSPRVRGKLTTPMKQRLFWRLIPACAGKTTSMPVVASHCTAHPRVCGENVADLNVLTDLEGSSPRVRGKRQL